MIGNLLRVSQNELDEYLQDSSKLEQRIYSGDKAEDSNRIQVDKSWEGISFLLSGPELPESKKDENPLSWILFGNKTINPDQNLGNGPAGYLTKEDVAKIQNTLQKLNIEDLRKNFDAPKMMALNVYPEIWSDEDESLEYLLEYYDLIADFYKKAAAENQAVIAFIH